jgi:hypothetical protein
MWRGEAPGGQSASPRGSLTPPPDPVREYGYQLTEHDPDRPWVVVRSDHLTVTLADDQPFYEWAHKHWSEAQFTITLDPWGYLEMAMLQR